MSTSWQGHAAGTPGYRRILAAMVAAGIATFSQLYSAQALMPALAGEFEVSSARAALTVSLATGAIAGFVLVWSGLADRFGRTRVMVGGLVAATALGALAPVVGNLSVLLVLRTVQGAALGGVPAVAVAYLAEEIHPTHLARATGVHIASNTLGGMSGRLIAGAVADWAGWRAGFGAVAALGVVVLVVFLIALPAPQGFVPLRRGEASIGLGRRLAANLSDSGMVALYCQGLFLMGAFVTVYNYIGFRLLAEPFGLSQLALALLYVAYLAGAVGSAVAGWINEYLYPQALLLVTIVAMALGALALLTRALPLLVVALLLFTASFFAAHTTASAWVGRRARRFRAQAAATYTLGYYLGSSLFGWLGGLIYDHAGWLALIGYVLLLCASAAAATLLLRGATGRQAASAG